MTDSDLLQLNSVLEKVLKRALDIIDKKKITLYKYKDGHRELFEILGQKNETYRFFPNINYCPCHAYQIQVLKDQKDWTCKVN